MAKKEGALELEGTVVEALPNAMFRVELANGQGSDDHQREDAPALHPHPARGPRRRGAVPLRPDARPDRLPAQVDDADSADDAPVPARGGRVLASRAESPRFVDSPRGGVELCVGRLCPDALARLGR